MKYFLFISFFFLIFTPVFSQEKEKQKIAAQPDLPANLTLDFGYNFARNAPSELQVQFWGSTTFNIYLSYDLPIGESAFVFTPGLGIGHDRYRFQRPFTLESVNTPGNNEDVRIAAADTLLGVSSASITNNKLFTNYLDIPLELQYRFNRENPSKGFRIAIGAKVGLQIKSQVSLKYVQNGESKKLIFNEPFDLNRLRYGAYARAGFGSFAMFYFYNISNLWLPGDAPQGAGSMSNFNIGFSLTLF